jgi:hypothetical protein
MFRRLVITTSVLLVFGTAGAVVQAQPQPQPKPERQPSQCFLSRDWRGWKASPDSRIIYLRIGLSQIYRLDLADACPMLQLPNAHLVNKLRGGDWICSPLDLDLSVSDGLGGPVHCLVKAITPLSREQAAALPKDQRP